MSDDPFDGDEFARTLVDFAREVRRAGVILGPGDVLAYCAAAAALNPADLVDLYWAGRATLVSRRDQIEVYDEAFRRYFLDGPDEEDPPPFSITTKAEARTVVQVPESESGAGEEQQRETRLGLVASEATTLKGKAFSACTPEEILALRRILRTIRLTPPRRRTRRTAPARDGRRPDLRRTVRETMRTHAEPSRLLRRERTLRLRPMVLILDVSGSMADYSRNLIQFAHTTSRATDRVEVFCFGTRLTRITRELRHRRPDDALDHAARTVVDWDGGTRIGESLQTFVREWGRRGLGRGGIVVICSDGLDRGNPGVLADAMDRLTRLCHRIVWLNPNLPAPSPRAPAPVTLGMSAAADYVDLLLPARDLQSLERFAAELPRLR